VKILLINPPQTLIYPQIPQVAIPLGLAYIGASLKENGYNVEIFDAFASNVTNATFLNDRMYRYGETWDRIKNKIKKTSPDIVGISDLFITQSPNAHKIAELVKDVDPDILTVLGGPYCTSDPLISIKDAKIDFIILGEGEYRFPQLVKSINENKQPDFDGLVYRKKPGGVHLSPPKETINDLDKLPFPAFDLLELNDYFRATGLGKTKFKVLGQYINLTSRQASRYKWMTMITSRGCPFNCIFCVIPTIWGKRWRARSADNIMEEILLLTSKYGIKEIQFEDDNLTYDRKRIEKILDALNKEKLDLIWSTPNGVRVDTLDTDLLKKIKQSGCRELVIGVESGDQKVLDTLIHKKIDLSLVEQIAKLCKDIDLKLSAFYVFGLPGETKENIQTTLDFARKLWNKYSVSIYYNYAIPLHGSKLFDKCMNEDLFSGEITPENYLRADNFYCAEPMIQTKDFTPRQLTKWVKKASQSIKLEEYHGINRVGFYFGALEKLIGSMILKFNLKLHLRIRNLREALRIKFTTNRLSHFPNKDFKKHF